MKKTANLIFAVLILTMAACFSRTSFAQNVDQTQDLSELYEKINSLNLEINSLRTEMQNQETSPPITVAPPKIKLMSPFTVNVKGGQTTSFDITLRNIGSTVATDIITLGSLSSGESAFTFEFVNESNMITVLNQNTTATVTIRISVDKNAKSGSYAIALTHTFKNTLGEALSDTDTLFIRVDNVTTLPNAVIHDFKVDRDAIDPGDTGSLSFTLENTGLGEATDVQIQISGLDSDKLYMQGDANIFYQKSISAGAKVPVSFNLTASPKVKRGTNPLTFTLKYKDKNNTAYESSYIYYINTNGVAVNTTDRARLELTGDRNIDGVYDTGDDIEIKFNVVNTGVKAASNIKITGAVADTELSIVPRTANVQSVQSLDVGEMREISFIFSPTTKSKTQNYPVEFKVEYETGIVNADDTRERESFTQYIGVNVINSKLDQEEAEKKEAERKKEEADRKREEEQNSANDEKKVIKPKIIIAEYASTPSIARAGEQFDLDIKFQNAHADITVVNVKVILTPVETTEAAGGVFSPVHGSNTLYFDSISPKGTASTSLRMYTVPSATPRSYAIAVKFKYQYRAPNGIYIDVEEDEQIGITVTQATKIETSEINIPSSWTVGVPITTYFSINNTGKVDLINLRVNVEGDFDTRDSNIFIGALNKGSSKYYDGAFTCSAPGEQKGTIIVSAENDIGEIVSVEREFTIEFTEPIMPEFDMMGMEGRGMDITLQQDQSFIDRAFELIKQPLVIGCAVGGLTIILIVIAILRKFVFKKKGNDFDE